jgi:hypothetical protein
MHRKRLSKILHELGFHSISWHPGLWINNDNKQHRVKVSRGRKSKAMNIQVTYDGTSWYHGMHNLKHVVLDEELIPLIFFKNEYKKEVIG